MKAKSDLRLFQYTSRLAEQLHNSGRERTAETYTAAVKSFIKFTNRSDIKLSDINTTIATEYCYFLKNKELSQNTISFYIRNLRAIYNHAVEDGIIPDAAPFRRIHTTTGKTQKRAIDIAAIRKIIQLDIQPETSLQLATDLFLFSFYTRGMAFVDIAALKPSNIRGNYLTYRRRKTSQQITILLEDCALRIIERYRGTSDTHIFPIIKGLNSRREYLSAAHSINRNLKKIGATLQLPIPLTFYVARHSWASIAYGQQIPITTISRALGHNSESTTRIYLATLDNSAVDHANKKVLESLSL